MFESTLDKERSGVWRKYYGWKRFTFDGPNSWSYYIYDLKEEPIFQMKRQMRRENIIIWGEIWYRGKTNIRFVNGKLRSNDYIKIIDEAMVNLRWSFKDREIFFNGECINAYY